MAVLLFDETAGAGVYTAKIAVPAGAAVSNVFLVPLAAPWDATTALLDMGDTLTGAASYYSAYNVAALAVAYDPTAPVVGSDYDELANAGSSYVPDQPEWPGVIYPAADVLIAVLTTTGAGGTTGLLAVRVEGAGFSSAVHRAVKV